MALKPLPESGLPSASNSGTSRRGGRGVWEALREEDQGEQPPLRQPGPGMHAVGWHGGCLRDPRCGRFSVCWRWFLEGNPKGTCFFGRAVD